MCLTYNRTCVQDIYLLFSLEGRSHALCRWKQTGSETRTGEIYILKHHISVPPFMILSWLVVTTPLKAISKPTNHPKRLGKMLKATN